MKNFPKPIRIIILVGALVGIGYFWYLAWKTEVNRSPINANTPITAKNNTNAPVDFIKTGTLTFNNLGLKENTPYFVFEEPGSPALSKEVLFDGDSICASAAGTLPCLAMNASLEAIYNGKRVSVQGISQADGSLLIKKMDLEK